MAIDTDTKVFRILYILVLGIALLFVAACDEQTPAERSVLYARYCHGTIRCVACLEIEEMARQAIEFDFSEQIRDGLIVWESIDYDLEVNSHYKTDYELPYPSLVLVFMKGEHTIEWKRMDRTWDLVDEPVKLKEYILNETRMMFRKISGL